MLLHFYTKEGCELSVENITYIHNREEHGRIHKILSRSYGTRTTRKT
jgi:hypothetical protein